MADECPACITSTGYCELHPPPLTLDPALVPYAIAMLKRDLAVAQAQLAVVRAAIDQWKGAVPFASMLAAAMDEAAEKVKRGA